MKIFFIQPSYAYYRNRLFKILSEHHDIHYIFEYSESGYPSDYKPIGISYNYLKSNFLLNKLHLAFLLLLKRPDIVISSTSYAPRSIISLLYSIVFNKPFILWIEEWHNRLVKNNMLISIFRRVKYFLGYFVIKHSVATIVSGKTAKYYVLSLNKNPSSIFTAMPCTDDISKMVYESMSKYNLSKNSKVKFLYLSRIIPRKGLDILLKAFYLLNIERPDTFLIIGGDGPFAAHCKSLSKILNIKDVIFCGAIKQENVKSLYEAADVYILPSYFKDGLEEPWGLVVNEAMSMNLPVIATDAVGASYDYIVNDYNGFMVKNNSVISLYTAMKIILSRDIKEMGVNARTVFLKNNNYVTMANVFSSAIKFVSNSIK